MLEDCVAVKLQPKTTLPEPTPKSVPAIGTPATGQRDFARVFIGGMIVLLLCSYAADHVLSIRDKSILLRDHLGLNGRVALTRQWWTPLTYPCLHFDCWHLAVNLGGLALFGYALSESWSWQRLLALAIVSSLAGAGVWLAVHHGQRGTVIGASAILTGYVTAYVLDRPFAQIPVIGAGRGFPRWILLTALAGIEGYGLSFEIQSRLMPRSLSHSAHIGGIAGATILCLVLRRCNEQPRADREPSKG